MGQDEKSNNDNRKEQLDIYRDTPIRLLGYCNEVGEAFRAWVPRTVVRLSYMASTGYVVADSIDKGKKTYQRHIDDPDRNRHVQISVTDTLIWQGFASVIIPGITINRICFFVTKILCSSTSWKASTRRTIATAIGLGVIPFIVRPIDHFVDRTMDASIRKYYTSSIR